MAQLNALSRTLVWLLVWAVAVTACAPSLGAPRAQTGVAAPAARLSAPPGSYFGLAWLPGDWLVSRYETAREVPGLTWQLWRLKPDGTDMEQIPLPQDPACARTRYDRPTTLPDGRLGLRKICIGPTIRTNPTGGDDFYVMAFDLQTSALSPLVEGPIRRLAISQFTWNPAMDRGMVGSSSHICATVAWLTPHGVDTAAIVVADGKRSWSLDAYFRRSAAESCADEGRADLPAWSPDGKQIAFFASPQSIGVDGQRRLDRPWNLYLMDPRAQEPKPVLRDVKEPRSLGWSPRGGWLAFYGEIAGKGNGLWLFEPAAGTLRRVAAENVFSVAWSPDGTQLAAVVNRRETIWPPDSSLLKIDVKEIVQGS